MSSPPGSPPKPKPKPGSLRDRIAAFEQKPAAVPERSPPVPRPKGHLQSWKPRAASPPPAGDPAAASTASAPAGAERAHAGGGMSASDAKEAIGRGGSLKERMAALQGAGAFGAPPPPAPPVARSDKPKWKPPPAVVKTPPVDIEEEGETEEKETGGEEKTPSGIEAGLGRVASPPAEGDCKSEGEDPKEKPEGEGAEAEGAEKEEPDPEEEERARRAAIAARMARLGGARVGMAPPVFGRKPDVPAKKPVVHKEEEGEVPTSPPAIVSPSAGERSGSTDRESLTSPKPAAQPSGDYFPAEPAEGETSPRPASLSPDATPQSQSRSPASMPLPTGPRRALPPRKKTPKTPTVSPPEAPTEPEAEAEAEVKDDVLQGQVSRAEPTKDEAAEEEAEVGEKEEGEQVQILADKMHASPQPNDNATRIVQEAQPEREGRQEEVGTVGSSADEDAEREGVFSPERAEQEEREEREEREEQEEQAKEHVREVSPSSDPRPSSPDEPEVYVKPKASLPAEPEEVAVGHDDKPAKKAEEEEKHQEKEPETVEEEEDEEARRKRIADKIAQMGGINPFSAPPRTVPTREEDDKEEQEVAKKEGDDEDDDYIRHQSQFSPSDAADPLEQEDERAYFPTEEPENKEGEGRGGISQSAGRAAVPAMSSEEGEGRAVGPDMDSDKPTRVAHEAAESGRSTDYESVGDEEQVGPEKEWYRGDDRGEVVGTAQSGAGDRIAIPDHATASAAPALSPVHADTDELDDYDHDHDRHYYDDDDEMAPPRIQRPLPPAPAAPPPLTNTSTRPDVPAPFTPPAPATPSKRTSIPPPSRPPVPVPTTEDLTRSTSKRASIPPPGRSAPVPIPEQERPRQDVYAYSPPRRVLSKRMSGPPTRAPPAPVATQAPLTHEPEPIADAERTPSAHHRQPSVSPQVPGPYVPTSPTARRSTETRRSTDTRPSYETARTSKSVESDRQGYVLPAFDASGAQADIQEGEESGRKELEEAEIFDDSDGDPIDPRFFNTVRSPTGSIMQVPPLPTSAAPPPEPAPAPAPETEEGAESARRRTIAERMAKLGGIKFGAPPGMVPRKPHAAQVPPSPIEGEGNEGGDDAPRETADPPTAIEQPEERTTHPEESQEETEEDEQARRARIAAKIAGMGGMRFGMLPAQPGVSAVPQTPRPPQPAESEDEEVKSGASVTSSDGVKVEAEESELEEVHYEDALQEEPEEEEEEEAPPPPPPRVTRPPVPTGRPPVPQGLRRSSEDAYATPPPHSPRQALRKDSHDTVTSTLSRSAVPPQSDYVMVEQEEIRPPPRSASRPTRAAPPPHSAPIPPPPASESSEGTAGQWELPTIPTGGLDLGDSGTASDLSASMWSEVEDSNYYPPIPPAATEKPSLDLRRSSVQRPPPPVQRPPAPQPPAQLSPEELSPEELQAVWGRVGVQVHEAAMTLHDRSKRALVGNGSYAGFVAAALAQVPSAGPAPPAGSTAYGYLVYEQSGGAVRVRASEIMPGDVLVLEDARLKGHKGLQTYHQAAGEGAPCVGVVSEFEVRKMKVRALQASQRVGQATVESVSYRLDDLKSGTIKVYRVLEA